MDEGQSQFVPPRAQVVLDLDPEEELDRCEDDQAGTQTYSNQTSTTKRNRKQTSEAWEYFNRIKVDGVVKAQCKYCNSILSAGSASGTSHLLKHAKSVCSDRHLNLAHGQTCLKFKSEVNGSSTLEFKSKDNEQPFSQEVSRKELVNMVVMHEYPLVIVDHTGFKRYSHSLNPSFKMISRNTLKSDILRKYNEDKKSLKALLAHNGSRISITTDMWTASNQKKGYKVVTSHFIDQQWVLRNRTFR
ncbi:zinc finger BED domain-containing protein RICESLEEPER 4-like [Beta vulgaris subsp. vulgaris]|uniref:zinc finger BED domain-containing protein RICESLEEPER 4-like n=1 Tax=Beta vulgaris subsp. vulgaris TaxID=3555 RepID=UPI002037035F|nr:zinc finger BED domain-containing protein RICESLEEPER 4-like [Beta vulgaris subsp. vulgaris]